MFNMVQKVFCRNRGIFTRRSTLSWNEFQSSSIKKLWGRFRCRESKAGDILRKQCTKNKTPGNTHPTTNILKPKKSWRGWLFGFSMILFRISIKWGWFVRFNPCSFFCGKFVAQLASSSPSPPPSPSWRRRQRWPRRRRDATLGFGWCTVVGWQLFISMSFSPPKIHGSSVVKDGCILM